MSQNTEKKKKKKKKNRKYELNPIFKIYRPLVSVS